MNDFGIKFPIKYLDVPEEDEWFADWYEPQMAPNVMVMRIVNGKAENYFFVDAEFFDEALSKIMDWHNHGCVSDEKADLEVWNVTEYGSSIEIADGKGMAYVLLPHAGEVFKAAFWVGLFGTFGTYRERLNELNRIRDIEYTENLPFHEAVEHTAFMRRTLRKADLSNWFNEGLIGRDYQDGYQDGLFYSPEEGQENPPMITVGSYKKNEFPDTHPFYNIGFTKRQVYSYLNLPPIAVDDYFERIPPVLGEGIMKAIAHAGHDPLKMQLDYIEFAGEL